MRKLPVYFMFFIAACALCGAYGQSVAPPVTTFPATLKMELGITGNAENYLPDLARVYRALAPAVYRGIDTHPRAAANALRETLPGIAQVVAKLNRGTPATLLLKKILATASLRGGPVGRAADSWRYGSIRVRTDLLGVWLPKLVRGYVVRHRWATAAAYEKAQLLLESQEGQWAAPDVVLDQFSPTELREHPRFAIAAVKMFGPARVRNLGHLWSAAHVQSAPWGKAFDDFVHATEQGKLVDQRGDPRWATIGQKMRRRIIGTLRRAVRDSVRTDLQWRLLGQVSWCVHHFAATGHQHLVAQIATVLKRWAARVKTGPESSGLAQQALVRWITEAAPPGH